MNKRKRERRRQQKTDQRRGKSAAVDCRIVRKHVIVI